LTGAEEWKGKRKQKVEKRCWEGNREKMGEAKGRGMEGVWGEGSREEVRGGTEASEGKRERGGTRAEEWMGKEKKIKKRKQ
jgi:hypothetical protein